MAKNNVNTFIPTLRLPILSSGEDRLYVSGFPGEEGTLRVILPGRRFLPLGLFRLALEVARRGEQVDRGRVRIIPERIDEGLALHVEIDPKEDDDENGTFAITFSPKMVKEISAALRLTEVIQDHYGHYRADERLPATVPTDQDGALFINDDDEADEAA